MQGKIVRWDEARGFGFVKEEITGTEIFIHISALNIRNPPPKVGEGVAFETAYNEQKGRTEVKQAAYLDKNRPVVLELAQEPRRPAQRRQTPASKHRPQRAQRNRRTDYDRRRQPKSNTWFWIVVAITIVAVIVGKFLQ